jgi:hypothetical protein
MHRAGSYATELETRIRAMRALLAARDPDTDSAALKLLREAFPDVSLSDRILACGAWKAEAPSATTPP